MSDRLEDRIELRGDPDALPEALFDTLAALLLDLEKSGGSKADAEEEAA